MGLANFPVGQKPGKKDEDEDEQLEDYDDEYYGEEGEDDYYDD